MTDNSNGTLNTEWPKVAAKMLRDLYETQPYCCPQNKELSIGVTDGHILFSLGHSRWHSMLLLDV